MRTKFRRIRRVAMDIFWGPQMLAFLPAICLGSYWILGEEGLMAAALGLPVAWAVLGGVTNAREPRATSMQSREPVRVAEIVPRLEDLFSTAAPEQRSAIFTIEIDEARQIAASIMPEQLHIIQEQLQERLNGQLRANDFVALTGPLQWLIALSAGERLDLEAAIQQSSRFQNVLDEPVFVGAQRSYFSASVGFTLSANLQRVEISDLLTQSATALSQAQQQGSGSIRAFSNRHTTRRERIIHPSAGTATNALENGEITAWFQPQISTDTGEVSGFEALARWNHPEKGVCPPSMFLKDIEEAGRLERLGEVMLHQALNALREWDTAGLRVHTVGVNVTEQDLSNPKFFDKLCWDLDRFDVAPHRLCIEILESVVASSADDMISRNVNRLSELGCQIDLDDFGTGHASISTLRRLPIARLKIDRSFVARADLDSEQQKMVATILLMAERLGLSTLAEGVETVGEHTMIAQLGCRYVQGYGIAKPMPLEKTVEWVRDYHERLAQPLKISSKRRG